MPEIIIGALVSIATQIFKWLVGRFGYEATRSAILIIVLLLSFIGAILYEWKFITPETINTAFRISAIAIAVWEVIYKRILKPALDRISEKN